MTTLTNTTITLAGAMNKLIGGQHLNRDEALEVMGYVMRGEATPAQIGGIATALRMKGETRDEITGFALAMRAYSNHVVTEQTNLLDTCGTGGSGIHKFNISTASSIIAASSGVRVAKHGNRAMSGKTGSADVLEALGVNITLSPDQAANCLNQIGIVFMFAQLYHPSLRHAAAPRKELGIRTIFNMLGPLTNPAGADRQLLGLYDRTKTETIAEVLGDLGLKRAMVVSSHDGLDEISISAPTQISELQDGVVRTYDLTPEELGLRRHSIDAIIGGEASENAAIIRSIFTGQEQGAYRDVVLANAGACIYMGGAVATLTEGVQQAAAMIDSGKALAKLEQLIQTTGELGHVS
ncbi:anthranilate phosphoribosyltransferase [Paenibacillus cellulosilyticus]|uniref:Anthranilate phosphoribosyltransferase n=1 Tax=Paenibacillus cellulosilyticus TaxID=375489 RepID=A0A2V2YWE3_9BACL|nr:anthranilate phosphoribosyltransferase [Paenibacillus cellulosilyticus]PWW05543.1 anthranilate phosphoribosyltransferase [Paenibacillus cellulosilyticus]QKS45421.1 anthranilate phosphoribosyltransferase [Paenibacillus cellulosilyticus]